MIRKCAMLTFAMLNLICLTVPQLVVASEPPHAEAIIGKPAPAFDLADSHGTSHSLSDYKGKVVVLEWFNNGCPFVKKHYESGNMQKLQSEFTERGVVWLTIASSAEGKQGYLTSDQVSEVMKEWNMKPSAYLIDASGKVGRQYEAKTTPHMFIIDPSGTLVYAGAIDDKPSTRQDDIPQSKNYVAAALNDLLAGKAVTVANTDPYGCSVKYAG